MLDLIVSVPDYCLSFYFACLVVNPMPVDSYASSFNCTTVFRASLSMTAYS